MPKEETAETALGVCSLAAASPTSAGKLSEAARPQGLSLPPLAWPECLAQPFHVLIDCQHVLLGCCPELSCVENYTGFQRGRQGGPYLGWWHKLQEAQSFPLFNLWSPSSAHHDDHFFLCYEELVPSKLRAHFDGAQEHSQRIQQR